ncbi:MAG: LacI family transcriptional regulator [Spirochaetia bacterium]|nr:LacI family transcriptional regulator [Spirochaetia bacterium]
MKRVTIKDIARNLGVAYSTVSMAMSDNKTISEKMKQKVKKKAAEMGYYPSRSARNLVNGRSGNIAVVTPGLFSLYEMHIVRGMEDAMLESGYDMVLHTAKYDWQEVHKEMRKIMYEQTADAVIVIGVMLTDEIIGEFKKSKVPLVNIDGGLKKTTCDLNIDNYSCGVIAAAHFVRTGRKRPALILGNTEFAFSQSERLRGFKTELKKNGISLGKNFICESPLYLPQDLKLLGCKAAGEFMEKGADSVYCANGDFAAQGVIKYCSDNNIEIPGQFSVIGTDNFDVADALNMTSIEQPLREMGKRAFETAEKALKNNGFSGGREFFTPKLVIRNT